MTTRESRIRRWDQGGQKTDEGMDEIREDTKAL